MRGNRLRFLNHVIGSEETEAVILVMGMCIKGYKGKRLKKRRGDDIEINMG